MSVSKPRSQAPPDFWVGLVLPQLATRLTLLSQGSLNLELWTGLVDWTMD